MAQSRPNHSFFPNAQKDKNPSFGSPFPLFNQNLAQKEIDKRNPDLNFLPDDRKDGKKDIYPEYPEFTAKFSK